MVMFSLILIQNSTINISEISTENNLKIQNVILSRYYLVSLEELNIN